MDPAEAPRLVLGTAGHIDHGKTALIRALTGVDTDRLPEEKARGISIELGFAPLDLPGGPRLSVVDVPGHEAFVRTMVAGATGIDLVLLVVAADEGVMPQTREHVAICELLGIDRGVVALTKVDAVGDDVCDLAAEEVDQLLAPGPLRGLQSVRVSALTGQGLDALLRAIQAAVADARPRTPRAGPPRLPIDRSFARKGFGSVVTGTLVGGCLAVGDAVEIQPSGARGRVRGLQSHGVASPRAVPGIRCALNLQGVEAAELRRGRVVSAPGALLPTRSADVELRWLAGAPPLESRTAVELLAGTAEARAHLAPIGTARIPPGGRGFARVHSDVDELVLVPGDRFIVRGFARREASGSTLGGGRVLDIAPPRRRRSDPGLRADLEALSRSEPGTGLEVRIRRAGLAGIEAGRLRQEAGLDADACERALAALASEGRAVATPARRWLHAAALAELQQRLLAALDAYRAAEPLRPGMPRASLRGALPDNVPPDAAELGLASLVARGELALDHELARRAGHRPALDPETEALARRALARLQSAGLEAPSLRDLAEQLSAGEERLRELLAHLERSGCLVRARGELWFDREAVDALRERVIAHLRRHGELATPDYKALIGTTRRTAVPLMELFDDERVTLRRGELRVLHPQKIKDAGPRGAAERSS